MVPGMPLAARKARRSAGQVFLGRIRVVHNIEVVHNIWMRGFSARSIMPRREINEGLSVDGECESEFQVQGPGRATQVDQIQF